MTRALQGLTQEDWSQQARELGIGSRRPATLHDLRKALLDRGLVRNYGDRWAVNYDKLKFRNQRKSGDRPSSRMKSSPKSVSEWSRAKPCGKSAGIPICRRAPLFCAG